MLKELSNIHKLSFNNKEEISHSKYAACFGCLNKFKASDIISYRNDKHALCPKCEKDCVIGDKVIRGKFLLPLKLEKKMFLKLNEEYDCNVTLEN